MRFCPLSLSKLFLFTVLVIVLNAYKNYQVNKNIILFIQNVLVFIFILRYSELTIDHFIESEGTARGRIPTAYKFKAGHKNTTNISYTLIRRVYTDQS